MLLRTSLDDFIVFLAFSSQMVFDLHQFSLVSGFQLVMTRQEILSLLTDDLKTVSGNICDKLI